MANVSSSNGLEKYPKLRFPGFAEPWNICTLGELFEYERPDKYIVSSEHYSNEYSTPVLTANQSFILGYTNETDGIYDNFPVVLFDDFTCDTKFVDFPFKVKSSAMKLLRPCEHNDINFAYALLQHIDYQPQGHSRHWISVMQPIRVAVPSFSEQKRIATVFELINKRIQKQSEMIEGLKKYKRGAIRQLLNPNSCTIQNAAWTTEKIGDIGTFIKGAPLSKADISDDGTPFILYGELYTTYNEVVKNVVRKTAATVSEQYYSHVGDVVIPTSGETPEEISTASCIMVPDVILAGDLNIFRGTKVDGRIMSYLLNHVVNNKIARVAQGKSVVHVQASEIANIKICYPDANTQKQLIALFDLFDRQIYHSEAMLKNMKILKAGLLQNMFV